MDSDRWYSASHMSGLDELLEDELNSTSWMKMAWNSASCMNNSASRLKIAIDSASLVEKSQYLLVELRIGESRDDSVSCVRVVSELLDSASLGVTRRVESRIEEVLSMGTRRVIELTRRVESVRRLTLTEG